MSLVGVFMRNVGRLMTKRYMKLFWFLKKIKLNNETFVLEKQEYGHCRSPVYQDFSSKLLYLFLVI